MVADHQTIGLMVARPSALIRLRAALPKGNTLPEPMWLRRHVWLRRPAVFGRSSALTG